MVRKTHLTLLNGVRGLVRGRFILNTHISYPEMAEIKANPEALSGWVELVDAGC